MNKDDVLEITAHIEEELESIQSRLNELIDLVEVDEE